MYDKIIYDFYVSYIFLWFAYIIFIIKMKKSFKKKINLWCEVNSETSKMILMWELFWHHEENLMLDSPKPIIKFYLLRFKVSLALKGFQVSFILNVENHFYERC